VATATPAAAALSRLFRQYPESLTLRLWDGSQLEFGERPAKLTIALRDPRALRDMVLARDPVRLAHDFFVGLIDIEGSIYQALRLKDYLGRVSLTAGERLRLLASALLAGVARPRAMAGTPGHSLVAPRDAQANSRRSIAFHYDLSNAFYGLWLDPAMVYSCAYFAHEGQRLEDAQALKLDLVCRKLRLAPGERLLDIGCGWGALAIHAAQDYGARVHGLTLSREQHRFACARVAELGLGGRVTVELRDYRDLDAAARYDKIASVGMFEHVGLANLPGYFAAAHRLLAPGGLFLNHGITSREPGWEPTVSARFINRYVFPDGELDSISNVLRAMEAAEFEILDVECLRPHYALTLRHWVRRLEAHRDAAVREVGEATYRVWRLYMAACALQFEQGETGVYQVVLAPAGRSTAGSPLVHRPAAC
jgi:cyclopropane-fatty-acyl-phospholipid synthase